MPRFLGTLSLSKQRLQGTDLLQGPARAKGDTIPASPPLKSHGSPKEARNKQCFFIFLFLCFGVLV